MSKIMNAAGCLSGETSIRGVSPAVFSAVAQWLAVYTTARHEKTVAGHFAVRQIESFLPLYRTVRKWKNGCTMTLQLPIFTGYIFVRLDPRDRVRVLEVPGVLWIVSAGDRPLPLPDAEIEALRSGINLSKCEPHPYLVVGDMVRIKTGALAGMEGVLLRKKGILRVVVTLDLIKQSVAVEVDATEVEPIPSHNKHYIAS
jgi:transcription antitermination factor NusG